MKYSLTFAAAALVAAACPGVAAAADTKFVLTGDYAASWILPETVELQGATASGFGIADVVGTFPGSTAQTAFIDFFSLAQGGGLTIYDNDSPTTLAELGTGEQLYTGTYADAFASPVWKTGTFAFSGLSGTASYTLNISAVTSAIPEPSTWALAMIGMALVGGTLRSRRTRTTVRFA